MLLMTMGTVARGIARYGAPVHSIRRVPMGGGGV